MEKKKNKLDLDSISPIIQLTKDRIESKKDKIYLFENTSNNITKFTKRRYILGESGEPLEQIWVEYVDLKNYNKIINNFNANIKELTLEINSSITVF